MYNNVQINNSMNLAKLNQIVTLYVCGYIIVICVYEYYFW